MILFFKGKKCFAIIIIVKTFIFILLLQERYVCNYSALIVFYKLKTHLLSFLLPEYRFVVVATVLVYVVTVILTMFNTCICQVNTTDVFCCWRDTAFMVYFSRLRYL